MSQIQGSNGQVEFDGRTVRIGRDGFAGGASNLAPEAIPVTAITAVTVHAPHSVVPGFIHFQTIGHAVPTNYVAAAKDARTLLLRRRRQTDRSTTQCRPSRDRRPVANTVFGGAEVCPRTRSAGSDVGRSSVGTHARARHRSSRPTGTRSTPGCRRARLSGAPPRGCSAVWAARGTSSIRRTSTTPAASCTQQPTTRPFHQAVVPALPLRVEQQRARAGRDRSRAASSPSPWDPAPAATPPTARPARPGSTSSGSTQPTWPPSSDTWTALDVGECARATAVTVPPSHHWMSAAVPGPERGEPAPDQLRVARPLGQRFADLAEPAAPATVQVGRALRQCPALSARMIRFSHGQLTSTRGAIWNVPPYFFSGETTNVPASSGTCSRSWRPTAAGPSASRATTAPPASSSQSSPSAVMPAASTSLISRARF